MIKTDMFRLIFVLCWAISSVDAIPIDNGVEGEPEIECGASTITASFNTRNTFEGHVYVKGRFAEQGCRNDENGRKVAAITLPFTACGVERTRSLNPRGIFVSTTVVITFHPQFLTKVDRAYTLQCFYMEADKTVSQALEVSEITTQFQSQQVPMPVCRYDILDGAPTGQPIKFALIGQQVYHKWTCTTDTTDIFCMVVHDCFVDDGAGNKVNLLNENGCALDRFLLQNLEYSSDLMAGREAHVFKYADKAALFFQCQITITIKEPGQECPRPQCPVPGGIGGGAVAGIEGPAPGKTRPPTRPVTGGGGTGGGARPVTLRPANRPGGQGPPQGTGPAVKVTGSAPQPSPPPGSIPPGQPQPGQSSIPPGQPPPPTQASPPGQPPPGQSSVPIGPPQPTGLPGVVPLTPAPGPAPTAGIGVEAPARRTKAPPNEPPPATGIPAGHPIPDQTVAPAVIASGNPPLGTVPPGPAVPGQTPPSNPPTNQQPSVIVFGGTAPPQVPPQGGSAPPQVILLGGTGPPQVPSQGGSVAPQYGGSVPPQVGSQPPPVGTAPPEIGSVPPQYGSVPPPIGTAPPQVGSVPPAQPYATNAVPIGLAQPAATGPPPQPIATGPPPQSIATGPPPASALPNAYASNGPNVPSASPPPAQQSTGGLPVPTSNILGGYPSGDLPLPLDFEVLRKKRSPIFADEVGTWDLRAQPIVTFDIDDDSSFIHDLHTNNKLFSTETSLHNKLDDGQTYCMTSVSLGLFLSFVTASVLTAVVFSFLFCMRKSGHF